MHERTAGLPHVATLHNGRGRGESELRVGVEISSNRPHVTREVKLVSSHAHARRPGPTLALENAAHDAVGSSATSGAHAISPANGDERRRRRELERDLERLQAQLTQAEAERDRLQQQLTRALEQIAAMRSEPAAPASITQPVLTLPPAASEQSLSRIVISSSPAAGPSDAERRNADRLSSEFEVEFLDDTHLFSGLTQDISQGGLFVATYHALPIGSQVSLALELPSGRVEVQAEVRWTRPECEARAQRPGFGVAFHELSPAALAALSEFCRSRPPHYYDS